MTHCLCIAPLFAALVMIAVPRAQAPGLLQNVHPTASSSTAAGQLAILGRSPRDGDVLVMLDDGVHGMEPWRTDGTAAGTSLLLDLTPGPAGTTVSPWWSPTSDASRLWFVVVGAGGNELWQSDGTGPGTSMFATAASLGGFDITPPQVHEPLGGVSFFTVDNMLWRTDGQLAGTFSLGVPAATVVAIRAGVALLTNGFGDVIASDGTTAAVLFRVTAPDSTPKLVECDDGQLLLRVPQYAAGSVVSTTLLWLDRPGAQPLTLPGDVRVQSLPDQLVLWVGAQVFAWDGIAAPTLLRQFFGVDTSGWRFARTSTRVFWQGSIDVATGREIWSTDGTVAGTFGLDSVPGPAPGVLMLAGTAIDDRVLVYGPLSTTNGVLHASDGTLAGTDALLTLPPGAFVLFENAVVPLGSRRCALSLQANGSGNELYVTGVAPGSAVMVADVNPGAASSLPEFLTPNYLGPWQGIVAGNALVWAADNGVDGYEPWILPVSGVRTLLRRYGQRVFTAGDPVLGGSLDFTASRLASGDLGVVGLGWPVAVPVPLGAGQFLHLDPTSAVGVAVVLPDASGRWSASLPLAANPALVGLHLVAQPFFLAPTPTGVQVGDAYWLVLGP